MFREESDYIFKIFQKKVAQEHGFSPEQVVGFGSDSVVVKTDQEENVRKFYIGPLATEFTEEQLRLYVEIMNDSALLAKTGSYDFEVNGSKFLVRVNPISKLYKEPTLNCFVAEADYIDGRQLGDFIGDETLKRDAVVDQVSQVFDKIEQDFNVDGLVYSGDNVKILERSENVTDTREFSLVITDLCFAIFRLKRNKAAKV